MDDVWIVERATSAWHHGGVCRILRGSATDEEVAGALRAEADHDPLTPSGWVRASLWEVGGASAVRTIHARDVGVVAVKVVLTSAEEAAASALLDEILGPSDG